MEGHVELFAFVVPPEGCKPDVSHFLITVVSQVIVLVEPLAEFDGREWQLIFGRLDEQPRTTRIKRNVSMGLDEVFLPQLVYGRIVDLLDDS